MKKYAQLFTLIFALLLTFALAACDEGSDVNVYPTSIQGNWSHESDEITIYLDSHGNFTYTSPNFTITSTYTFNGKELVLNYGNDSEESGSFDFDNALFPSGVLELEDTDGVFYSEKNFGGNSGGNTNVSSNNNGNNNGNNNSNNNNNYNSVYTEPDPVSPMVGTWIHDGGEGEFTFYADNTFEFTSYYETFDVMYAGYYYFDGSTLTLESYDGRETIGFLYYPDNSFTAYHFNGYFWPQDSGVVVNPPVQNTSYSYFEDMGLYIGMEANGNKYTLDNGGAFYKPDGSEYYPVPVDYAITVTADNDLGNGYRELNFTVNVYFSWDDFPGVGYNDGAWTTLADYYTGYLMPANGHFNASSIDDNKYDYQIPFNGEMITVSRQDEFSYQNDTAGSYSVYEVKYYMTMPVDYDGLVLCMEKQPTNFSGRTRRIEERRGAGEHKAIGDYPEFNIYDTMYCRFY